MDTAQDLLDKLTAHLGPRNPFAHEAEPETDIVWLFNNTASQNPDQGGAFTAQFVAAFFARRTGDEISAAVAEVSEGLRLAKDDKARETIEKRLEPFFHHILPSRKCTVNVSRARPKVGDPASPEGKSTDVDEAHDFEVELGPSDPNGISKNHVTLPGEKHKDGHVNDITTTPPLKCVAGHTTFATPFGWAVISDIDDTIKRTLTNSASGILQTTFADTPQPIQGMPEFYRHMVEKLRDPPFWYLSASPYNLYEFLSVFREQYYPEGTMILRDASWQNIAGFIASMSHGTKEYKVTEAEKIYKDFPQRKFVCIGDSTQKDPESYGELYRKYPEWIKGIFIRRVEHVEEVKDIFPGEGNAERNRPERFEAAFKGIPEGVWHVFDDPKQLYAKLDQIVQANPD